MVDMLHPLIVANWKMYGHQAMLSSYVSRFRAEAAAGIQAMTVQVCVVFCPPHPYLLPMAAALASMPTPAEFGDLWALGAQNCAPAEHDGPATGEISPGMLKDCGCKYVIVGHSERRRNQAETDSLVAAKGAAAMASGLIPIICIGETDAQAKGGLAEAILTAQIAALAPLASKGRRIVIAYEPIWAIGTGRTPTMDEIASRHGLIRQLMQDHGLQGHILYGGSVKAPNAVTILSVPDVDGVLVGSASLDPSEFAKIALAKKSH